VLSFVAGDPPGSHLAQVHTSAGRARLVLVCSSRLRYCALRPGAIGRFFADC